MDILVLNGGSSSVKASLFKTSGDRLSQKPIWQGALEWKENFRDPKLVMPHAQEKSLQGKSLKEALLELLQTIEQNNICTISSIKLIGHRIVHGGIECKNSHFISKEIKERIRSAGKLAPLHNEAELEIVEIMQNLCPKAEHVAVFDTAFHQTMPPYAKLYPLPYEYYQKGIRRFGFHGINFRYTFAEAKKFTARLDKVIVCHLGSGASLCAIKGGKSIDTTMGLTPLDGLMMDTRCGSLDPGVILRLFETIDLNSLKNTLYYKSGLLGISGRLSDMRDIIKADKEGDEQASLALSMYQHSLRKHLGAMIASLGGVETLIFTAGIGENSPLIRKNLCKDFSFLGIEIDKWKNESDQHLDRVISTKNSRIDVLVIHAGESLEIARNCLELSKDIGHKNS